MTTHPSDLERALADLQARVDKWSLNTDDAWVKVKLGTLRTVSSSLRTVEEELRKARDEIRIWKNEAEQRSETAVQFNLDRCALGVEVSQLTEALDGYRAAVSYIGADSWDGCSDCIEILKAARSADTEWRWTGDQDRVATELKRIRQFAPVSSLGEGK